MLLKMINWAEKIIAACHEIDVFDMKKNPGWGEEEKVQLLKKKN